MSTSSSKTMTDVRPGQTVVSQKLVEKPREMRHPAKGARHQEKARGSNPLSSTR